MPSALDVTDMRSLVDLARRRPDALSDLRTGAAFRSVGYRGQPQGIVDLLAGRIQLAGLNVGLALPHLHGGALRAIATIGPRRLAALPDVPTVDELNIVGWAMAVTRAGVPAPGLARIAGAFCDALATPFGFREPGRFSIAYRALFGESPSETLRAATRAADIPAQPSPAISA